LGSFHGGHGFGASPIVLDDLIVVPNDQDGKSSLVGLETVDGKRRWQVPRKSQCTYTTPCVHQPKGKLAEIIFSDWENGLTSIDPKTGAQNWQANVFSKGHIETGIGSPIIAGDLILGTCGWLVVKTEVVAVRPGLDKPVYRLDRSAPLVTTPLVKG